MLAGGRPSTNVEDRRQDWRTPLWKAALVMDKIGMPLPGLGSSGGAMRLEGAPAPADQTAPGVPAPKPETPDQIANDPRFNTILPPGQEQAFRKWKARYAPKDSGYDYDLRGAFKAGLTPDAATGHFDDRFKKPNHPTFSVFSQYAKDMPHLAGTWDGDTYVPAGASSDQQAPAPVAPTPPDAPASGRKPGIPLTADQPETLKSRLVDALRYYLGLGERGPKPYAYPQGTTADDLYGSGIEGILADTRISPEVRQQIADAQMAAHHSAVSSLGMDPRRTSYEHGLEAATGIAGRYDTDTDTMKVDPAYASVPVHEGMHRGLEQMRKSGVTPEATKYARFYGGYNPLDEEELLVRAMMSRLFRNQELKDAKVAGIDPTVGRAQVRAGQKHLPIWQGDIRNLEAAAAKEIARRRPGGPR